jgi:hypothetical protein
MWPSQQAVVPSIHWSFSSAIADVVVHRVNVARVVTTAVANLVLITS